MDITIAVIVAEKSKINNMHGNIGDFKQLLKTKVGIKFIIFFRTHNFFGNFVLLLLILFLYFIYKQITFYCSFNAVQNTDLI